MASIRAVHKRPFLIVSISGVDRRTAADASTTAQRAARVRGRGAASLLHARGAGAERHAGGGQPSDQAAGGRSGRAAVPAHAPAAAVDRRGPARSEARRVGKEWVSTWRSRWSQYH